MKFKKTIEVFDKIRGGKTVIIYCDEFATFWSFSVKIFGHACCSILDYRIKKSEWSKFEDAFAIFERRMTRENILDFMV